MDDEVLEEEGMSLTFYSESDIENMLANDEIMPGEAGFMRGYIAEIKQEDGRI